MPRPLRICMGGMTYHVYSRCVNRRDLMRGDVYKEIFIDTLRLTQEKYSFNLIAYQILDNHFHLIIKTSPGEASISLIMQYFKARFAERYNKKNSRTGPFWNERFGDVVVDHQSNPVYYLLWLLWYLAYNAVRKNVVRDPRKYKYGSLNHYLDENYYGEVQIVPHDFFLKLGGSFAERVKKFLVFEDLYRKRSFNF